MAKKTQKKEALTVSRFIKEVLVDQLHIPFNSIVNDTTFSHYTGSKRPDLLISEVDYDLEEPNEKHFVTNLLAYAEAKDYAAVDDSEWKDAYKQGLTKSVKLGLPYFIVTNCKVSYFYNALTGKELKLNGNPIREFQSPDVLRLILKRLKKEPIITDIKTSVDTQSAISEAIFNKKLWELANIYRALDFKNISEKIDFTIGFIALKVFEEKIEQDQQKDQQKVYWSDLKEYFEKPESFRSLFGGYINRLENETDFKEFRELIDVVNNKTSVPDDKGNYQIETSDTI